MGGFQSDLRQLSQPLTEGLRVRHIAHFELDTRSAKDDDEDILKCAELAKFDQIPLTDSSRIVAVLERDGPKRRQLDEDILVSADESLANFIHTVRNQPYRLVVDGTRINGIVTWSDLLKIPVLSLGYSLLAQLELVANRAIEIKFNGSDDWLPELQRLDPQNAKRIESRKKKADRENLSLPLIELADLVDKLRVIEDFLPLACEFQMDLNEVVGFRNVVDHVRPLIPSKDALGKFVQRLETVVGWIAAIKEEISRRRG